MGPRLFRRGNKFNLVHALDPVQLQWGHVFSDVEIGRSAGRFRSRLWLQWGHVFSDVEIVRLAQALQYSAVASMGPRLFRRGNIEAQRAAGEARMLQWGHVFSDVEMPGILGNPYPNPSRFNEATSFQTWKSDLLDMKCLEMLRLQWGHVFSDVEIGSASACLRPDRSRFNGATSFQTWKCQGHIAHRKKLSRFNGATSFQTWKLQPPTGIMNSRRLLQWGHVFSDVEIWKRRAVQAISENELQWGHVFSDVEILEQEEKQNEIHRASMGPRLFRRGNWTCQIQAGSSGTSFNGATSFQTWK